MNNKKLIYTAIFALLCAAAPCELSAKENVANEKIKLSQKEILGAMPSDIIKPLPYSSKWIDNENFELLEGRGNDAKSYNFNVKKLSKRLNDKLIEGEQYVLADNGQLMEYFRVFPDAKKMKNITISPDKSKAAYTKDNNLYVYDYASKKETALTNDGTNLILNGYASWVYYEEILGRGSRYKAFWWSPDSKTIAYYKFDDTKVPMFPIYDSRGKHGFITETHYPKAGDPNPEVKIAFVDLSTGKTVWADFNKEEDQYFGIPFWNAEGNKFIIPWMPREQNNLKLYAVDPKDGSKTFIYDENQKTWIDWPKDMQFTAEGFYMVRDFDLWEQIYFQSFDGKKLEKITSGKNWGIDFIKVDSKENAIYFTARREVSTRNDFYRVDLKTKAIKRLSIGDYNYSNVSLSPNNKYFTANISNSFTPDKLVLINIGKKTSTMNIIADSKGEKFDNYKLAIPKMLSINVDGYTLPAQIILPIDLDTTKQYPVIISMYGGPNSGTVMDVFRGLRSNTQWWANEGVIQINIDHRASGHCGKEGLNFIHRNLLKTELSDYIQWVKYLYTLPYVNKDKIGITGFSYGGSMTMIAVTEGSKYFKYGIAGGGVYDYNLYDSHYTERYMDTPESNPQGYAYTRTADKVANYKGDKTNYVKITHGLSDDNVHMQNTIQLIDALQNAGKQFELMLYPGEFHGYRGAKSVHSNMGDYIFWYRHLLDKDAPEILTSKTVKGR